MFKGPDLAGSNIEFLNFFFEIRFFPQNSRPIFFKALQLKFSVFLSFLCSRGLFGLSNFSGSLFFGLNRQYGSNQV